MHDVQEFHFPEFFSAKERLHRVLNSLKSIGYAQQVIVSFEHIKNDLQKFFPLAENDITVCPPPIAANWFAKENYTDFKTLQNKYSIYAKFILYPAAVWKHKNHKFLLRAFKNICKKKSDMELIFTGNNDTEYFPDVQDEINMFNLSDKVKFLGMVPDEDLIGLYKATSLVVIPTLYEAGSGPLYEAMRFGAPVICARTTSLPDTMNNDKFTFDPFSLEDLEELMEKILSDSNFIDQNLKNSKERIDFYKDQDYASAFLTAYKKAITAKSAATA
jgi:glycosyltransferase involved in cell wall biosynthesis